MQLLVRLEFCEPTRVQILHPMASSQRTVFTDVREDELLELRRHDQLIPLQRRPEMPGNDRRVQHTLRSSVSQGIT